MRPLFRHDLHDLSGVYAIDAIDDPAERVRFEHHLRRCQSCASEVRGLSDTATRLAFAASRLAPAELRGRVLATVSRTRQLPPSVDHHRSRVKSRPALRPQLGWAAAAACLVVAVILGAMLVSTRRELTEQRQHQTQLTSVLFAPDVQAVTKKVRTGGTATLVFSLKRHSMIVTSAGLPPLRAGKVYQLWLIGEPATRSAGLLPAEKNGHTRPFLVGGVLSTDTFGLTVEPAGGTKAPTTTPILLVPLKHHPKSAKT